MKRGDATMVAAVLLIVGAVVVGVLVASFSRETEKKVEGEIERRGSALECEDVGIGIEEIDSDKIRLTNGGTLGINKIAVRYYTGSIGSTKIDFTQGFSQDYYNNDKLDPGIIGEYGQEYYDYPIPPDTDKIEFIPIIINDKDEEIGCENKIVTWRKNE